MNQKRFYFDIETGPGNESDLINRFNPTFEPDSKITEPKLDTRLKDPVKIAAAQEDLAIRRMEWQEAIAKSVSEKRDEWIQQSCLRAERGSILAIGYTMTGIVKPSPISITHGEDEDKVIRDFLQALMSAVESGYVICGFNHLGFDLPFIRRRCIIKDIPFSLFNATDKWKPWKCVTFDALVNWQSGNFKDYIKLGELAIALGVGRKNGDGSQFWQLYRKDKESALLYLRNDIDMTVGVCDKMIA